MTKDEIFVVNQPKHSILSIVIFEEKSIKFPLPNDVHENLYKLAEKTDLFFIFKGKSIAKLDLDKFSSLYESTGWIYTDSITKALFKTFQYGKEIFDSYVSYSVWNSFNVGQMNKMDIVIDKLIKFSMSDVKWPVFKYSRLTTDELYKIYKGNFVIKDDEQEQDKDLPTRWYNSFWKEPKVLTNDNKYTTYKSDSKVMFFKSSTINKLISAWEDEYDCWWINTFTWDDPRYLLASLCKHLGFEIQNNNLENLDIG